MLTPVINIPIPQAIFQRFQRIAAATFRPIEEVIASTLTASLPLADDLPDEITDELAAMTWMSDDALWAATQSSIGAAQQSRLRQLSHLGGERTLSASETAELDHYLNLHDLAVLRRARAMAILAQRGHVVTDNELISAHHVT